MSYVQVTAKFNKVDEDGKELKATEHYLVDADNNIEAETIAAKRLVDFYPDYDVTANKRLPISEILGDKDSEKWWLCKVRMVVIDEISAKEKKSVIQMLAGAPTFEGALQYVKGALKDSVSDTEIVSISESPIVEYIPREL